MKFRDILYSQAHYKASVDEILRTYEPRNPTEAIVEFVNYVASCAEDNIIGYGKHLFPARVSRV